MKKLKVYKKIKMEQKRRLHLNELKTQLMRLEKTQSRDLETFKNLPLLKINVDIIRKKQSELKESIQKREKEIEDLKYKMENGEIDKELKKEIALHTEEYKTKNDIAIKKKKDKLLQEEESKNEFNKKPKIREYKPNMEKDFIYFYKHYCKADDTLPEYIRRHLSNMPNNKGYIWKGCWFFGNLPSEKNGAIVMFEKLHDNITKIHEIENGEYKIFEKYGKDRKKLICTK